LETFKPDIDAALQTLRAGGIILYPTDTIWGIGCDATNGEAIRRIFRLKKRDETKSMIILLASLDDIGHYVSHPPEQLMEAMGQAGTPMTGIFRHAINLPQELINDDGSIAIRVVRDTFCETLVRHLEKPLVSTSANLSGQPAPENFAAVDESIREGVDYIVRHRQDDLRKFRPSSIIRVDEKGNLERLR